MTTLTDYGSSRRSRNEPINTTSTATGGHSRLVIMFGGLKSWHRVATRYDRRPTALFAAIAPAATIILWP